MYLFIFKLHNMTTVTTQATDNNVKVNIYCTKNWQTYQQTKNCRLVLKKNKNKCLWNKKSY